MNDLTEKLKKAAALTLAGLWSLGAWAANGEAAGRLSENCRKDALDTRYSLLYALDKVERALICREGDGREHRNPILRTFGHYDLVDQMPDWAVVGIKADAPGKAGVNVRYAYALLMKQMGELYGLPEFAARGRTQVEELLAAADGPIDFRDESAVPPAVKAYYALMAENRADLAHAIRPGGVKGSPFWNGYAKVFIYPPSFAFREIPGAVAYRYRVVDDVHRIRTFEDRTPLATLAPVWPQLPAGFTTVFCEAVDAKGGVIASAGERTFWRNAPFDPAVCKPARVDAADACRRVADYLFGWPEIAYLEQHGRPDLSQGSNFTSYPSKMQAAVIDEMLAVAELFPERRERALRLARISADYLLSTAQPTGTPLEHFTATYVGTGQLSGTYAGQQMLVYPANAGRAFVRLHAVTGEARYLEAARGIAKTYARLQDKDGTWFLKMYEKDGRPVSGNRLVPVGVVFFLEELFAATGDETYRRVADRAFGFIDRGPLTTWDWEGQFEDIRPLAERYRNLTKHNACETAMYLLKRFPGDVVRLRQARDIVRFAEDQFVMWRKPCRADGTGSFTPIYPFYSWRTPVGLEQYNCYAPIDASAAKMIRTYLALYRAEGKALDLAKARALGDSMINNQDPSGRIRTYWVPEAEDRDDPLAGAVRLPDGGDWYNCMVSDMMALSELIKVGEGSRR